VRKEFIEQVSTIDPENIIYIDESGTNSNIVPQYGWSEKGLRSYAEQSGFRTQRLSIIAGYNRSTKEIFAPFEYSGYTDTGLFNGWFEQQLLPALKPGNVVILDNASFHKDPELRVMAEEFGIGIIYLPAYSPDLNPIEKFWANLKRNIRKVIKKCESLQEAITQAFKITLSC
jgi:isftu1 transposase